MVNILKSAAVFAGLATCSTALSEWLSNRFHTSHHLSAAQSHIKCPVKIPYSCTSGTSDSCCIEASNGLFLATQFWDFYPATGPDNLFTTHGLWSDRCDGTYDQFCNPSWALTNVTEVLLDMGEEKLLKKMKETWKNQGSPDEELWLHEFNKHGTCMSTVNPDCYPDTADKYRYAADFFNTVVNLQKTLPTFDILASAGIHPSNSTTYKLADVLAALKSYHKNHDVYVSCKNNAIQEVWYYYQLQGSVAGGHFLPIDTVSPGKCPDDVYFVPKGQPAPSSGGGGSPSNGKGNIKLSGQSGCIISGGTWFTSGTCASFTLTDAEFGGVNIKSSKGFCNVIDGALNCASGNSATQFITESGSNGETYITYGGQSEWSADHVPASQEQVKVSPGSSGQITFKLEYVTSS